MPCIKYLAPLQVEVPVSASDSEGRRALLREQIQRDAALGLDARGFLSGSSRSNLWLKRHCLVQNASKNGVRND